MFVYDTAHTLAQQIKQSEEYKEYKALKDEVYQDEKNVELLKQYKRMQFEAQSIYMSGKQPDEKMLEQLQKIGEVLQFNPKMSEFMIAEYKFNTVISDIYKIIGDACDIATDFLSE